MSDKFVERLEKLYERYRPNTTRLPTADQILSGMVKWPRKPTFDQAMFLHRECLQDLAALRDKYGKQNALVDERLDRYLVIVDKVQIEIQVLVMKSLLSIHRFVEPKHQNKTWRKIMDRIKPYVPTS